MSATKRKSVVKGAYHTAATLISSSMFELGGLNVAELHDDEESPDPKIRAEARHQLKVYNYIADVILPAMYKKAGVPVPLSVTDPNFR